MVRGAEHSAPLKVKYQRLHAFFPWVLRVPIQYTWRAVSEKFLVNTHSCAKNKNYNNNYNNNKNKARTRLIIRCFPALYTSKRKKYKTRITKPYCDSYNNPLNHNMHMPALITVLFTYCIEEKNLFNKERSFYLLIKFLFLKTLYVGLASLERI